MKTTTSHSSQFGWSSAYRPIWIIYSFIVVSVSLATLTNGLGFDSWMKLSMGAIALVFALFKCFDLTAFANDFANYDIVARRWPVYGRAYPFIEAGIGLLFLASIAVPLALVASILVFGVGLIGVWRALQRGEAIQCACVGKMFDLPLSRVALFENGLMIVMSVIMLTLMGASLF